MRTALTVFSHTAPYSLRVATCPYGHPVRDGEGSLRYVLDVLADEDAPDEAPVARRPRGLAGPRRTTADVVMLAACLAWLGGWLLAIVAVIRWLAGG